jgi:hypothetical protein
MTIAFVIFSLLRPVKIYNILILFGKKLFITKTNPCKKGWKCTTLYLTWLL